MIKSPSITKAICGILAISFLLAACGTTNALPESARPALSSISDARSKPGIILATTTSLQDSGLLDFLIPLFEKQTGYRVQAIAVGTGQALKMGEEGNADVLFVHDPELEKLFMENGYGKDRALVMHNDFVIAGPASDPAKIKGLPIVDAYKAIAEHRAVFISRGDDSGTHKAELALWNKAEINPQDSLTTWYLESGQGMGASLTIASEKNAYIFTDRATYLANKANLSLEILVEGDKALLNVYHVITVNPQKRPQVNYDGAIAFLKFLTTPEIQNIIGKYGDEEYGQPLFIPDAGKPEFELGQE